MRRALGAAALVGGALAARRLGRRSGVTDADLERPLPGDDLVAEPTFLADRATVLEAPAAEVWPWLVQTGKERGGWPMPSWLEPLIVRRAETKAATRILPELQTLAPGDEVPDYGPGDPVFRVAVLEPQRALVYLTLRDRARDWRWPKQEDPLPDGVLVLSWALVLEELDASRCRLHIRLRARRTGKEGFSRFLAPAMGFVDYLTIVALFAGLKERLAQREASSSGT